MYMPATDWNPKQKELNTLLKSAAGFEAAIALCLEMHQFLHMSEEGSLLPATLGDMACFALSKKAFITMPTKKDETIAWHIWHIARIEDITMNILVANNRQVFNKDWQNEMGVTITDTANAMTDEEVIAFSAKVNQEALLAYRAAVGACSKEILLNLTKEDLSQKFTQAQLDRILDEGCLITHPDSIWLQGFWGKKDVRGILTMPLTRHQAGHLNKCLQLRHRLEK